MPFTPFHFGPNAAIAIPLYRYVDIPAFMFVNVVLDLEPLMVMTFSLSYPLHGYTHSFLGAAVVSIMFGFILYGFRGVITEFMHRFFKKDYSATRAKMILSSVLGGGCHVFLDSIIHVDIKPFYPLTLNPFLGMIGWGHMHLICAVAFIPALVCYVLIRVLDR